MLIEFKLCAAISLCLMPFFKVSQTRATAMLEQIDLSYSMPVVQQWTFQILQTAFHHEWKVSSLPRYIL